MKINQWAADTYPVAQKHLDTARTLENATKNVRPTEGLKRLHERNEIGLLLRAQADVEAAVVELHHLRQRRRKPVVEVRRTRGQAPQNGPLKSDMCSHLPVITRVRDPSSA